MQETQQETQVIEHNWEFSQKQTLALETLEDPKVEELLYGGAKGGGKSVFFCRWAYLQCRYLIEFFGLDETLRYPIPVGFLGRKRGTDFRTTTLETWKKFIPSDLYRIRPQDKEIIIEEKVKIFYGGLDDEKNINKFNSAEFAFVGIDQAEEINRTDLALLKGTLRLTLDEKSPNFKVLLTANPAPCFLRQDYIDAPAKDGSQIFIQALPSDNPYLPDNYVNTLTKAFKHRPELVDAYVYGSWDKLEGSDVLIKHSWVTACVDSGQKDLGDKRVTVCDIAAQGNDETVIYNMVDNCIVGELIIGAKPPEFICPKLIEMASNNSSSMIAMDCDGFGGGVAGLLRTMLKDMKDPYSFLEIRSGKKADDESAYVNARSEMWFHAAKIIAEGQCSIPNDQVLIGELSGLKYNPCASQGRFAAEPKKEYKKRLDGSPDRADAFIYGLWATTKIPSKKYDFGRVDSPVVATNDSYGWGQLQEAASSSWNY